MAFTSPADVSRAQNAVLISFPGILLLGWLIRTLFRVHVIAVEPYFKRNFLNEVFGTYCWYWTTGVLIIIQLSAHSHILQTENRSAIFSGNSAIVCSAKRYCVHTLWFIAFLVWFFGPSIQNRISTSSGGHCVDPTELSISAKDSVPAKCRNAGGTWTGGFNYSGHSFVLSQMTLMLFFEYLKVLPGFSEILPRSEQDLLPAGHVTRANSLPRVTWLVAFFVCIWWISFTITAIFYHTFLEKVAGLATGYFINILLYIFLPSYPQYDIFALNVSQT